VVDEIAGGGGSATIVAHDLGGSRAASEELAAGATEGARWSDRHPRQTPASIPLQHELTTDEETFDRVFAVNVKAPYFLTAAITSAAGAIMNLGSWIVRLGIPIGSL
jgi:NAD(P)-dependent dehydrogenase (short-subunit alcohol dehydrogenase family)